MKNFYKCETIVLKKSLMTRKHQTYPKMDEELFYAKAIDLLITFLAYLLKS